MEAKKVTEEEEERWRREIVTSVMRLVSTRLPQTDLISLLLVSPWLYRTLVSYPSIWLNIDLREMTNAGDRLLAALSLCPDALLSLKSLNLNGCQKISDSGIEDITSICPKLKVFSIYWNSLTDKSMELVAESYQELQSLNITSLTDKAYKKISLLADLRFLDLCGAQFYSATSSLSVSHHIATKFRSFSLFVSGEKRQLDRVREQRKLLIDDYVAKGTIRFMEETKSD
ncbi:hypothetical protein CARUB_v10019162mg [Capsella rubella]|uniref:F-box domain-containing protein n=1 Tax=Capsella rubella TaxID=81985 RepID=R0HKP3_9BRAS|nr:hypothetical protein CARUB_v10019162mg [Capsella rubella]